MKQNIRNFSIIAHIDHGKSTLADRILERCGAVDKRLMEDRLLDNMELERERGITIKARAVRLEYETGGQNYILNLIDTPGHVDFNYEVSRALAACEGALLVVDASQGVEAQTLANTYIALENELELVPVINKIDLVSADVPRAQKEITELVGLDGEGAVLCSAKDGRGIDQLLLELVKRIPPPGGDEQAPLKALIFDSVYDPYRGVVVYIRVMDGVLKPGDNVLFMGAGISYEVVECGYMEALGLKSTQTLKAGEVGYFTASIKEVAHTRVGDTVTHLERQTPAPLKGYRDCKPMVFCGIYPLDGADYDMLKDALFKLKLNDAAFIFEAETSTALGFGFRCGFLGLLHLEIIQQRLRREFNLDIITTAPSVSYLVALSDGSSKYIDNPSDYPDPSEILSASEPYVRAEILSPAEFVGNIMELCKERRGTFKDLSYIDTERVSLKYELPLGEIIYDFFDALKSRTRGFASFDYEFLDYRESKLVKLDILLNGERVDALSFIVHSEKAYPRARRMAEKLKDQIPRQLFEIPIQAAVGGKIIARETVKALRKDVLAKCYGGDITRKKKLLEKQKEGKKRMRSVGSVQLPQEAFMAVLKLDD